ncbi:MAG: gephyrin-like molybdotransferase Glp [Pseudomonadota bacterium]
MTAPPLKDDCFALPPGVDWTPVEDALAVLRNGLAPVTEAETLRLTAATGRVLSAPVTARRAHPAAANSAVDGYGFAATHLPAPVQDIHTLPLHPGRAAAGAPFETAVPPGRALRVLTGAALPAGVDTVVLDEDVTRDGAALRFRTGVKPGANCRAAGEDTAAGATVLQPGRRLRAPDLALAAAVGVGEVSVRRPLRVAILSTGDELAAPGTATPAAPHRMYDANRPMLRALLERWGIEVLDLGIAPDDRPAVHAALARGRAEAHAVIASGGASAGDEDHVAAVLHDAGVLHTWRIAVKPGRPLALANWDGVPIFGLPGNPVAAFVCALIFARPALSVLAGETWPAPLAFTVPAAFSKRKKPGRREYLRARLDAAGAAEVFASEGSGRVSGIAWAQGLVELPDGGLTVSPGDPVRFLPYAGFGL